MVNPQVGGYKRLARPEIFSSSSRFVYLTQKACVCNRFRLVGNHLKALKPLFVALLFKFRIMSFLFTGSVDVDKQSALCS